MEYSMVPVRPVLPERIETKVITITYKLQTSADVGAPTVQSIQVRIHVLAHIISS